MQLSTAQYAEIEQEIINLSKDKWKWMSEKNAHVQANLLLEKAMFTKVGDARGTDQDLNKSGGIWYKKKDINKVSVNIVDNTVNLLNRIDLLTEVGGNEATNPFEARDIYIMQDGKRQFALFHQVNNPSGAQS